MTDFGTIKTTLEEQIRSGLPTLAGNPDHEPRWWQASDHNVMSDPVTGWKVFLRLVSIGELAVMTRYTPNEINPGLLDENICSLKRMVIELKVEADYFDADASRWAFGVVEHLRSSLRLRSVRANFLNADMALTEMTDTNDVSLKHGGRTVNAAAADLIFNTAETFTAADVDWFNTVLVSSEIETETGDPHAGNFIDKQIGPPA